MLNPSQVRGASIYRCSTDPVLRQIFRSGLFLLALFIAAMQQATAAGATPEHLDAWSDWVLDDIKDYGCPVLYNVNKKQCSYPGRLELELDSESGTFSQSWSIFRESTVYLPGDREHWPLSVSVDGHPAPVVSSTGRPAIRLDSGEHTVNGHFKWQHLPESLMIPAESGLVSLRLSGTTVIQPDIRNGQLWLSGREDQQETARRVDIRVFRKITDAVPLHVTTRIELDVSGEQREINLSGAIPNGFEAFSVDSRIPARLDDSGQLALKVRPGRWVVSVSSRQNRETLALTPGTFPQPWPAFELWVFEARPNLRMLEVEDPPGIDASQSALPEEWKHLPAYRMQAGATMTFRQIRRGDPLPEPDQLTLSRQLWLDFSGEGYTVSDHIGGSMSRGWRINAGAGLQPGQVTLDGRPQLITRAEDGSVGIEVRQGNINLAADSRIEKPVHHISATGWEHDFSTVSANLNVPPGYRVIAIAGADRTPGTWLSRWTLLDFFIVLITSIALSKIHGIRWGAIGLAGLVVLWHEPGAPGYIWLNLIATLAIMRALRDTRVYPFARNYLFISSLALVLLALPFMVEQVRNGIYPQLEHAWQSMGQQPHRPRAVAVQAPALESVTGTVAELDADQASSLSYSSDMYQSHPSPRLDKQLQDPDARLQTGPGLPEWTWRNYPISWNGPVQHGQLLSVYFINPTVNLFLNLFRVCIVLLLAWKLIRDPVTELLARARQATAISLIALVAGGATMHSGDAMAGYPPQELLQELRKRLLEPAECLPQCAELEHLVIQLDREQATFSLQAHAMEDLAMPLPVPLNDWTPSRVSINGGQALALFRDRNDTLWVYLDEGVHDIVVHGRISHLRTMRLDFPLPPHRVEISLDGWSSDDADLQSPVTASMTFTREQTEQPADVFDTHSNIPAFAHVSRHIRMGIDWQLVTTVTLESGTALPARLRIPLLDGERVVTDHIQVEDNHAHVNLSESSRSVSWQSTLEQADTLTLKASQSQPWSETWSMEVTPIWNVSYSGIPVIYHQRTGGQWNPEWRPWPGEQVLLTITRPQGIEGQTKTIEHSLLSITPGKRASTAELAFTLRSSQGQQHTITLPRDATLQEVSIGGKSVPIRQDGRHVTLPLTPGSQDIHIKWKEARGIDWWFSSSQVDLGIESVNSRVVINHGYDRWVLLSGGIKQGPAVLFWGVLLVIVALAIALGRFRGTPLRTHSWILLGIGLSTVTPFTALLIAVWIFALYARCQMKTSRKVSTFNMIQIMLVVLTVLSVIALFNAVSNGLLGNPDMQIAGNGSTRSQLNWYQDRLESALPQAWIISLPVLVYRILMLAWSMWMAFALINWLKWGWGCFSKDRLWMAMRKPAAGQQGNNTDRPAVDGSS